MQRRVCPECGNQVYSADESSTWECCYCGAELLPPGPGVCRVCGCTDMCGCMEGCWWVEPDLCSNCVGKEQEVKNGQNTGNS